MDINYMRQKVESAYDGPWWRVKVSRMADNQVIAIYHSLLNRGKFDKQKKTKEPKETYVQLSIFDILKEKENQNEF